MVITCCLLMRKHTGKGNGKNGKSNQAVSWTAISSVDTVGNSLNFNTFVSVLRTKTNQHFARVQESYIMFINGVINVAHKNHLHCLYSFREKRLAAITDSLYSPPIHTYASKQSTAR